MRSKLPAIMLAVVLALPACGERAGAAGDLTVVTVGMRPYISYAPLHIAQAEGYFEEQGLKVEFIAYQRGALALAPLAQGQLDVFAGAISVGLLNGIGSGSNMRIVADKGHTPQEGCAYSAILAQRRLQEDGTLTDPDRIRGLRLGVHPEAVSAYFNDRMLAAHGLGMEDLQTLRITGPARLGALQSGAIDLGSVTEPWLTRTLRASDTVVWVHDYEVMPGFQLALIAYGPNLLEDDPETGRRFMVAYLRGVRQYAEGKTERNLQIMHAETGVDMQLLKECCWPPIREDGAIDAGSLDDFQAWALEEGLTQGRIDPDDLWDPRFVEHANRVLAVEGADG